MGDIELLDNSKCAENLCFLNVAICLEDPTDHGWTNYKNIFDQCSNLKEIELFSVSEGKIQKDIFAKMSEPNRAIWQERMTYFEKRGIEILEEKKIYQNENLRAKVAQ